MVSDITRTSIITHITKEGRQLRLCIRCQLKVDKDGNPDPAWYDAKTLEYFKTIPVEDRCLHKLNCANTLIYIQGEGV